MKEIEVKILEVNVADLVARLIEFHAEKTFDGDMDVIFYDYEDHYFKKQNKRLRLRRGGKFVELTFKKKLNVPDEKVVVAEEYQVDISDFETMRTILGEMNMIEMRRYQKSRQTWKLREEGMVFTIDTLVGGVPPYMEVEGPTEEKVFEWVKKLGFSETDTLAWSGSDVLRHYGIQPEGYHAAQTETRDA